MTSITVDIGRPGAGMLVLDYRLEGLMSALCMPAAAPPARADDLWQHSCFEAFLAQGRAPSYREFNFAPSSAWAAYRFDSYRQGRRDATMPPPSIDLKRDGRGLSLRAVLEDLPSGDWSLGVAAVIEDREGALSYWAVAHPPGKADFHHKDCFALQLPPAV